jgi:hypothetical protein
MTTNFDLAPPGKTVDGLAAVPIDIQHVTAKLTFDGATSTGTGDATVDFVVGPAGGCPIFDLRQTITAVWLDGTPLTPNQVAHHDFGGGPGAELRVVDSVLAAGSSHTLRVTYSLGTPQASTAGSYQPAIAWSPGPRLRFNFGFTDLGPGRYLESWVPANLIFDQFDLALELEILNTAVTHVPITNGAVTPLGANSWAVAFPARFTAFSPLLELRAADTVTSLVDTVALPASGTIVSIEAWKPVSSTADLSAQMANLKTWLAANDSAYGQYLHGGRFVAFVNVGGMEYDGGTTSSPGSLRHETHHSWWGRGVKPASQADGWWDEAWTVYNDLGASGAAPLDFASPAVELSSRNPWVRSTPGDSYTKGEQFFEGAASLIGVTNLKSHMRSFFLERNERPVTTADLEAFLVCRSGAADLVDAFHRFVYGFPDPSPAPDLWIKDDPADPGGNYWAGTFWNSPDLWIRHADDGGLTHQSVRAGRDNWFYARVRNRSSSAVARHFLVTFNVKPFMGVQFEYPTDFMPCIAAAAGFALGPGESTIVKARWPAALVPPAGTHACWLASVLSRLEKPAAGANVWEHNNLAQKNLAVVSALPGDWTVLSIVLDRLRHHRLQEVSLELLRPPGWRKLEATLVHHTDEIFASGRRQPAPSVLGRDEITDRPRRARRAPGDCAGEPEPGARGSVRPEDAPQPATAVRFRAGRAAPIPLRLPGKGQLTVGLGLRVPDDAKPGDVIPIDLVQRDVRTGRTTGGVTVELHVKDRRSRGSNAIVLT